MKVITGGKITAVEARRMKEGEAISGMNVNINIEDVRAEKNRLTVRYSYNIDYAENVAQIKVKGELYLDEKNAKELEEKWRKTKQVEPAMAEELLTAITYAGTATGTLLAFSVNIQAPINVPRARIAAPSPEQKPKAG
ncbi:MAG: hypothetical protein AB1626_01295 [Candidatus Micrarchaeota archaeon]